MSWNIHLYTTSNGQPVVQQFIEGLGSQPKAKLARQLDLLEEYGINLGMPHARPMGDGLVELHVRGKQEVRVFYIFTKGKNIYLLHGFIKKTQETPKKELDTARKRKKEVESL